MGSVELGGQVLQSVYPCSPPTIQRVHVLALFRFPAATRVQASALSAARHRILSPSRESVRLLPIRPPRFDLRLPAQRVRDIGRICFRSVQGCRRRVRRAAEEGPVRGDFCHLPQAVDQGHPRRSRSEGCCLWVERGSPPFAWVSVPLPLSGDPTGPAHSPSYRVLSATAHSGKWCPDRGSERFCGPDVHG